MGSDEGSDSEKPIQRIHIDTFEIARYEVTNSAYAQCVRARECRPPDSQVFGVEDFDNHPVVEVTWQDANDFCRWIGGRLPTEAEWEKAATWDPGLGLKVVWPWGSVLDPTKMNSFEEGPGRTTEIGSYPVGASPYGALDMAGNVWEWTSTLYREYPYDFGDGRENPDLQGQRVARGGSFLNVATVARGTNRARFDSSTRANDLGFRCIRDGGPK
jgi:formylglycine-generating enzyme required for sulfatase activity